MTVRKRALDPRRAVRLQQKHQPAGSLRHLDRLALRRRQTRSRAAAREAGRVSAAERDALEHLARRDRQLRGEESASDRRVDDHIAVQLHGRQLDRDHIVPIHRDADECSSLRKFAEQRVMFFSQHERPRKAAQRIRRHLKIAHLARRRIDHEAAVRSHERRAQRANRHGSASGRTKVVCDSVGELVEITQRRTWRVLHFSTANHRSAVLRSRNGNDRQRVASIRIAVIRQHVDRDRLIACNLC